MSRFLCCQRLIEDFSDTPNADTLNLIIFLSFYSLMYYVRKGIRKREEDVEMYVQV